MSIDVSIDGYKIFIEYYDQYFVGFSRELLKRYDFNSDKVVEYIMDLLESGLQGEPGQYYIGTEPIPLTELNKKDFERLWKKVRP